MQEAAIVQINNFLDQSKNMVTFYLYNHWMSLVNDAKNPNDPAVKALRDRLIALKKIQKFKDQFNLQVQVTAL